MTTWGYTLSSEEHPARQLIDNARRAEKLGFDFVSVSDHYHPWIGRQGHSPFVWSTVGGVAATTERVGVGVGVSCPIVRIHPAIVAQAAATSASLMPDRFFLGVGTGEALNEHITGAAWPRIEIRQQMLEEAVSIIRQLWTGDNVDFDGRFFQVDNARLYTRPSVAPPLIVSAFGEQAADLAARIGDGMWTSGPAKEVVDQFHRSGGKGPVIGQVSFCWDTDADRARKTAYETWPNKAVPGQLSQDLPTPSHFEQACELVTEETIAKLTPCGPDVGPIVDLIERYRDAGVTHLYLHQIGPDQDAFFRLWESTLAPRLEAAPTRDGPISNDRRAIDMDAPGNSVLDYSSPSVAEPNEPA